MLAALENSASAGRAQVDLFAAAHQPLGPTEFVLEAELARIESTRTP